MRSPPALLSGTSAPKRSLHLSGRSGQFAVRKVLADLTRVLQDWSIPTDQVERAELVAGEALNNVIEHAFGFEDGRPFSVEAELQSEMLTFRLKDEGTEMPGLKLPEPKPHIALSLPKDGPREDLPEGGWGWGLIHALSDSLTYDRVGDSNRLVLTLNLAAVNHDL